MHNACVLLIPIPFNTGAPYRVCVSGTAPWLRSDDLHMWKNFSSNSSNINCLIEGSEDSSGRNRENMKMWSFRCKNNRRKRKIIMTITYLLLLLQILKRRIYMDSHTHLNITATPWDQPGTSCWNFIDREAKVKHLTQDYTASGCEPRLASCQVSALSPAPWSHNARRATCRRCRERAYFFQQNSGCILSEATW